MAAPSTPADSESHRIGWQRMGVENDGLPARVTGTRVVSRENGELANNGDAGRRMNGEPRARRVGGAGFCALGRGGGNFFFCRPVCMRCWCWENAGKGEPVPERGTPIADTGHAEGVPIPSLQRHGQKKEGREKGVPLPKLSPGDQEEVVISWGGRRVLKEGSMLVP